MVDGKIRWEREYYPDESLMWEVPYLNGQVDGVVKGYYRDGSLKWETPFVNGQFHGVEKQYRQDGTLHCETEYYYGLDIYEYLGDKQW